MIPERPGHRPQLLTVILLAAGVSGVLLAMALWGVSFLVWGSGDDLVPLWESGQDPAAVADLLRSALAVAGLIVGAGAAVIAYRNQLIKESTHSADRQKRLEERYVEAATQLGSPESTMRVAGAYAMSQLAAEWSDPAARQRCVDVLCSCLRMPGARRPDGSLDGGDAEFRRTILRCIATYVKRDSANNWGAVDLDLIGANLPRLTLRDADLGAFRLADAVVAESVNLVNCQVADGLDVRRAAIGDALLISGSSIGRRLLAEEAVIDGAFVVRDSTVTGHVIAKNGRFHKLSIVRSVVESELSLNGSEFIDKVSFSRSSFRTRADFTKVRFLGEVIFKNALFSRQVVFTGTAFAKRVQMGTGVFVVPPKFVGATKMGVPWVGT